MMPMKGIWTLKKQTKCMNAIAVNNEIASLNLNFKLTFENYNYLNMRER